MEPSWGGKWLAQVLPQPPGPLGSVIPQGAGSELGHKTTTAKIPALEAHVCLLKEQKGQND